MHQLRRAILALATAAFAVAGCGPASAPSPTPEPREAVVQALRSTAELDTVHALLKLDLRDGSNEYNITIEGDVNVAARELDVTADVAPEVMGATSLRLVVADGFIFSRMNDQDWSISGDGRQDPLSGVPTTARIVAAVEGAIRDPSTSIALEGIEPCGEATCFRIRAEITPEVAWRAVTGMLSTNGQSTGMTMPDRFPGFAIDLWIEQATLRLRQATNTTVVDRQTLAITVALDGHDDPVTIVAPTQP